MYKYTRESSETVEAILVGILSSQPVVSTFKDAANSNSSLTVEAVAKQQPNNAWPLVALGMRLRTPPISSSTEVHKDPLTSNS